MGNAVESTNMETAHAPVNNEESRNDPSAEPTILQSGDTSTHRDDMLPYLLNPDITLAIEVQGETRFFPWFSDSLQHRAYATVDQFLRSDDGRTITAAEAPSLRLGTMPRPLHISPNHTLLGMRTWLNGWIHFYATKGDEDRANGLRNLQRVYVEVPSTQRGPTTATVPDDDYSDGDDAVDETVVVGRSSFQHGTPADKGLIRDSGPKMDSTNQDLPNVTMNATAIPADAPTDRQEDERRDHSGITWAKMREKYGKKRACEDAPQKSELLENTRCPTGAIVVETTPHVNKSDNNSQSSTHHETESTNVVDATAKESRSVESGMWWGKDISQFFDDVLGVYRSPEEAQIEPENVTDEVGDILHQAQPSRKKDDQSKLDEIIKEAPRMHSQMVKRHIHWQNGASAAAPPSGQTSELPVFFIDPFGHTHKISLKSCTYRNFQSIVLSKCNEAVPNHIRERVVQRQFSILTTDGTVLTRQNSAQMVLPGCVLEMYWQQKKKHSNKQDLFRFDNLPTRHPLHAGETTAQATSQPGTGIDVSQSSKPAPGDREREARGVAPIIPRDVNHNHDKVGAKQKEEEDDSTILNNLKRQSDTALEKAASKRRASLINAHLQRM
ncbi:hypothetical protein G7Y79_00016g040640 [Physcia stellaris]|nr:hypothetical protein G7Y79_00016g040640 [Physcia stellaris]